MFAPAHHPVDEKIHTNEEKSDRRLDNVRLPSPVLVPQIPATALLSTQYPLLALRRRTLFLALVNYPPLPRPVRPEIKPARHVKISID